MQLPPPHQPPPASSVLDRLKKFLAVQLGKRLDDSDFVRAWDAFRASYSSEIQDAVIADCLFRQAAVEAGDFIDGKWANPKAHETRMTERDRCCTFMSELYRAIKTIKTSKPVKRPIKSDDEDYEP